MPRPIVLGNGRLLVAYDDRYRIRELCYPHVGFRNHLSGNAMRLGVWIDGRFSWCDSDQWQRQMDYMPGSLTLQATLANPDLQLTLATEETAAHDNDILLRRIRICNHGSVQREIRLFVTQHLDIDESDIGNCAFHHPGLGGLVHYKGSSYFLFGGRSLTGGVVQYAAGFHGVNGSPGTWTDAEDGILSMKPIEQGSVDSTFAIHANLPAGGQAEAQLWIVCARSMGGLEKEFGVLRQEGAAALAAASYEHWQGWSKLALDVLANLPDDIRVFARQSLLILKTQIDGEGAILAANDSDIMASNKANYSYVWPRDGALVADALDRVGYHEASAWFFRWCKPLISTEQPYFLQKYNVDGTFGASWHPWEGDRPPLQEDESGLTLYALAGHQAHTRDQDLLGNLYEPMVVPLADFLVAFRTPDGLPQPSHDLWEERRGIHTFTAFTVVAGLRGAAQLAMALGDDRTMGYALAADEVLAAIKKKLVHKASGALIRGLKESGKGVWAPDATPDASLLLALQLGVIEPSDPIYRSTVAVLGEALSVSSGIGGVARYPGDYYFRQSESYPGNPWIICTLWLAQCRIAMAISEEELEGALDSLRWAMRHSCPSGVLPEQLHPETGAHLSVSPLTWSHAEFIKTCADYCESKGTL
ncbi:MAG: glycoside hydrolase family 15 protein [Fimbriimonadaceae bacterium]